VTQGGRVVVPLVAGKGSQKTPSQKPEKYEKGKEFSKKKESEFFGQHGWGTG